MFDAGVNLLDKRFDAEKVINNSIDAGLTGLLIIASDLKESEQAAEFCQRHSIQGFNLLHTAGVHPHQAKSWNSTTYRELENLLTSPNCVAIGECGLDFNRNFSTPEQQRFAFEQQLILAQTNKKGVYLHERDAFDTQMQYLQKYIDQLPFAIAHCFTGNKKQLCEYQNLGCYIGITGWVCDRKRGEALREAILAVDLSKLLLETDSPYLFPKTVRPRSSNNEPKYIHAIAEEIAAIIGIPTDTLVTRCNQNAEYLFAKT